METSELIWVDTHCHAYVSNLIKIREEVIDNG